MARNHVAAARLQPCPEGIRRHSFMDKFVIRGGNPLLGTIRVSGAKNAALPAMAAALLTAEPVILENIPDVRDIETTRKLLVAMGAEVELGYGRAHHRTTISCRNLASPEASYELVRPCAPLRWFLGRWSRATAGLGFRSPEAALSVRARLICTLRGWNA